MGSGKNVLSAVLRRDNLFLLLAAGAIGEIVLEFLAWWIFPSLIGKPMRPHLLVTEVSAHAFAFRPGVTLAVSIHLALGLFLMPVAYDAARRFFSRTSWLKVAVLYGIVLWATAQMTLAPLAGRPFMLGIDFAARPFFLGLHAYSWGSFAAHIIYTVTVGWAFRRLGGQR